MKSKIKRIWYAVQENKSDGWDGIGSYDFREAAGMLKSQGYGLIAAVDEENQFCVNEYTYEEVVAGLPQYVVIGENAVVADDLK